MESLKELEDQPIGGQLLTRADIAKKAQVTYGTVVKWQEQPNFPKPIKFSGKAVRFKAEEVTAWIDSLQRGE